MSKGKAPKAVSQQSNSLNYFHYPLMIAILFGIVFSGIVFYSIDTLPPGSMLPERVLRYSSDAICRVIFAVWLTAFFYACLQFIGLKLERREVLRYLSGVTDKFAHKTPQTFKTTLATIARIASGKKNDTGQAYKFCIGGTCETMTPKMTRNACFDFGTWHHERAVADLYVLNFAVWVLPILGFIGTVWGISLAVVGLDQIVQSAEATPLAQSLQSGLNQVLAGLSTAFDTTFLGLIFAILIMIPNMFLRRKINLQTTEYSLALYGLLTAPKYSPHKSTAEEIDAEEKGFENP